MNSNSPEVLATAYGWYDQGYQVALAILVSTWGSAPRPPGAVAALRADGVVVGSISGGCLEPDLLAQLEGEFPQWPQVKVYGVTTAEAQRFGLPCGGRVELVLEPVSAASRLLELCQALERGAVLERSLDLASGMVNLAPLDELPEQESCLKFNPAVERTGTLLRWRVGPAWRLLIIGAGEIGRYLAEMAPSLDFMVQVCDPRTAFRHGWPAHLPSVCAAMPDDFVIAQRPDIHTAIVAVTHDLKQDDLALLEALRSRAFYVGALGSARTQAARRARLCGFDLSALQIERLHGPVGLPLGSRTAAEIAVAILAELIAVRRGRRLVSTPVLC